MESQLSSMDAVELAGLVRSGQVSPVEILDDCLARIDATNESLNAIVFRDDGYARERARWAERAAGAGGQDLPLLGIPIVIKDLFIDKTGWPTTHGSIPFRTNQATSDSLQVQRLEAAGAVVVGKTNVPEFGIRGTTDNKLWGPTSTPFRVGYNAGGSSGGTGSAVAAGMAPLGQGSDGGGSVRIPAAMCGIVGIKPSFGVIPESSRPNAFALDTPFIHNGPMARTVDDAWLMLQVMAGVHRADPFSVDAPGAIARPGTTVRMGFSPDFGVFPVDPRVDDVVRDAVASFEAAGHRVELVDVDIPHDQRSLCDLWMRQIGVFQAETAEVLKRDGYDITDALSGDICDELLSLIDRGRATSALDYRMDQWIRTDVFEAIESVFDEVDILLTPTVATAGIPNATDGNTKGPSVVAGEQVDPLLGWCLTYPTNFSGHPSISVPAGLTGDGMPVGLQIIGRRFEDELVAGVAKTFEEIKPWAHTYRELDV